MYFRRSLNKIVKVRPFVSSLRYSHGSPLLLSTYPRNFSTANVKKISEESEKTKTPKTRAVGIDLMAPNFRSNSILKSTSKNRKEIGGQFHTMPPRKSLILKLCRQPSKYMSTSHAIGGHGQSKPEKNEEIDTIVTRSRADICQAICGPNSANFTSEALATSSEETVSKSIIDKLTDAEIEEICKTRCPCRESHTSNNAGHSVENQRRTKTTAAINSPTKHSESSTATVQSAEKLHQDSSTEKVVNSSSSENLNFSEINRQPAAHSSNRRSRQSGVAAGGKFDAQIMTPPNMQKKQRHNAPNRYRINSTIAPRNISSQQYSFTPVAAAAGTIHHPVESHRGPNQLTSKYNRMKRAKQLSHVPFRNLPRPERNMRPNNSQGQITCHSEQLKPVPYRYLPVYPRNYHSDLLVKNRAPRFDAMHVGVPYQSTVSPMSPLWHKWQEHQMKSFGSSASRNRQTLQSNVSRVKWPPSPIEFSDRAMNGVNVSTDNSKAIVLPVSKDIVIRNAIEKIDPVVSHTTPTESIDTVAQQSTTIMSKVVENLSVVVEGPGKLKLVTSSYPQLRDEKDVIIRMEYVNLTDADARHYLTGKYSPYSYATTVVGRTGSGIILETGKNVHNVKPGDKVFIKPVSCGKCSLCLSDRQKLCEYITVSEMSPMQGILNRLHVHSSDFVTKIPDNVTLLNGALTGTLSTAIRACQKASVSAGDYVLVIDGGPLGTAAALAAQLMGATNVCLADHRQPVLDEAQKIGIDKVFLIDQKSPSKNTAIKIWELIGNYPRVTFDCRGSQLTNEIAINATQTGGKVVVMTNSENGIPLPLSNIVTRDIDIIISTFGNDESDIAALRILNTKKMFFGKFMHKHYDLSNVREAFEHLYGPNRLDSQIIVKCGCKCANDEVNSEETKSK